jgi:hypothetical protein
VSFSNLVIMEGTALYSYLAVQCLVLLNVTLMALDVTRLVRTNWQEFKTMYYPFPARKKPRTEEEVRDRCTVFTCCGTLLLSPRFAHDTPPLPHGRCCDRLQRRGCR